jgi:hypothetical protein
MHVDKPPRSSDADRSVGAATGTARSNVIRLRIDQGRYDMLEHAAREASVSVEQLVGVWLRDRVDQLAVDRRTARIAVSLDKLVRMLSARVTSETDPGGGPRRTTDSARAATSRHAARRPSLHDEIVEVLRESGTPMTAAEIARQIRLRGEYSAPRSGLPITGTAVSRRVANPYYRSLFEREGRQLTLADRSPRPSD